MDAFAIISHIVESPNSKKYYKDLQKYYESQNMMHEANAIKGLIGERFADNPPVDKEQRTDN